MSWKKWFWLSVINKKQKIVILATLGIILVTLLFPPVIKKVTVDGITGPHHTYEFLFNLENAQIDRSSLAIQWLLIVLLCTVFIQGFKDKKPKDEQKQ